jgi:hypothetical protein
MKGIANSFAALVRALEDERIVMYVGFEVVTAVVLGYNAM